MKKIVLLVAFVFNILFIVRSVSAAQFHYQYEGNVNVQIGSQTTTVIGEAIRDFNTQISVNKDGTISVTETIVYDFYTSYKHGIFRNIPDTKTNSQGKKFRLNFSDINVSDENDRAYPFTVSHDNDQLSLKIGDPDKTITGIHTYVIRYKVAGALTYFSDHDELYWNVTGNDWDVPIVSSTAGVKLPVVISPNDIKTACYTGYRGSTATDCRINNQFDHDRENVVTAKKILNAGEGLTVAVSFPKNSVAVLEPKEIVPFSSTLLGKIVLLSLIILVILWYFIYPLWLPIKWWLYGRDPQTAGPVRAWFDPPKTMDGRPLSAIETGSLIDERCDMRDISAMIVQLAQKGYLKIAEKEKGKFTFIKQKDFNNPSLLAFEQGFLKGIFGNKKRLNLDDEEFYEPVKDLKSALYQQLVTDQFFVKNPQLVRNFYAFILGVSVLTFNLPLLFSSLIFGRIMPRKTMFGAQTANVARSLKNFLSSQERQLEFQAKNQMMFEKLLPYAVAFGVEKIWAGRFKDINMTPPDWYQGYGAGRFNSVIFVSSMNSSFSSFGSAAAPPMSTTSSSGFGSGFSGGFSGGGGGGGGGGGW